MVRPVGDEKATVLHYLVHAAVAHDGKITGSRRVRREQAKNLHQLALSVGIRTGKKIQGPAREGVIETGEAHCAGGRRSAIIFSKSAS